MNAIHFLKTAAHISYSWLVRAYDAGFNRATANKSAPVQNFVHLLHTACAKWFSVTKAIKEIKTNN
jgi:hypothetical protein